jgi:hypothetical protein
MNADVLQKNRRKRLRVVAEVVVLVLALFVFLNLLYDFRQYAAPLPVQTQQTEGFIALSYKGVGRTETSARISRAQLERHLQALYDAGYVTISQADIAQYYAQQTPLPAQALFLIFEDGRPDTYLQVQPLLEKFNYQATLLTYGINMLSDDEGYLAARDLQKMVDTGYWEIGTSGNRVTFINAFDQAGRYLGLLDGVDARTGKELASYSQYTMDFIRDQYGMPLEDAREMEARLGADYEELVAIYEETLGNTPRMMVTMSANVLGSNTVNPLVEAANLTQMQQKFQLAFTNDLNAVNTLAQRDAYHLTRLQVESSWTVNHLLTQLGDADMPPPLANVESATDEVAPAEESATEEVAPAEEVTTAEVNLTPSADPNRPWLLLAGMLDMDAAQRVTLTSPRLGQGIAYLTDSEGATALSVQLTGITEGMMGVYLRYNRAQDSYVRVLIVNNSLVVQQKSPGDPLERYVASAPLTALASAAEEVRITAAYALTVQLAGDKVMVSVDGVNYIDQSLDAPLPTGGIALTAAYDRENRTDPVYDATFTDLAVSQLIGGERSSLYFAQPQQLWQGWSSRLQTGLNRVIEWAVNTF